MNRRAEFENWLTEYLADESIDPTSVHGQLIAAYEAGWDAGAAQRPGIDDRELCERPEENTCLVITDGSCMIHDQHCMNREG